MPAGYEVEETALLCSEVGSDTLFAYCLDSRGARHWQGQSMKAFLQRFHGTRSMQENCVMTQVYL